MNEDNKYKLIIVILSLLIVVGIIFAIVLLFKKDPEVEGNISLNKDKIEINSEVMLLDLLKVDENVNVVTKNEKIDTSELGKKELTIEYKSNDEIKKSTFLINVVDTIKPEIEYSKEVVTNIGVEPNFLKNVTAHDNSKEKIEVKVEGTYDIKKSGSYSLKYVAHDSSDNKIEGEFTLIVMEKNVKFYEKLAVPNGEKKYVGKTSKNFDIYTINESTYIEDILIANKSYPLGERYIPENTYTSAVGKEGLCNTCINKYAYSAWNDMKNDAAELGLNLWLQSGYRPYEMQVKLYNGYVNRDGVKAADTYSSRPGHSEHQTGLSFDLNTITNAFANTKEGKWVNDNCYKYGYIIRFPKGKDNETGYQYEPWHIRYVGTDLATKLYNNGNWISLEDYFGITSTYED